MCSSDTFDALVTAYYQLKSPGDSFSYRRRLIRDFPEALKPGVKSAKNECDLMRRILIYENARSCTDRYRGDSEYGDEAKDLYQVKFAQIGEVNEWAIKRQYGKILNLMASYEYQACECDDWESSAAYGFCRGLEQLILNRLRNELLDAEKPSWGGYTRPAGNTGPISLAQLMEARK